jgi:hypothetical protein
MEQLKNCPNCGAPIENHKCPYCGTIFYDFAEFEVGKTAYIRLNVNGNLNVFRAVLTDFEVIQDTDTYMYFDNTPVAYYKNPETRLAMNLILMPDDKGVIMERYVSMEQEGKL